MNPFEEAVLEALAEKPASGGKIIERLQAQGSDLLRGRAVVVYGALCNLARERKVKVVGEGPGERVYGLPDSPPSPPSPPGHPPSFSLGAAELALVEKEIAILTERLPPHYFEELRRAVVADADRRAFHGEKLPRAAASALADLGSPSGARGLLKDAEKGRAVSLDLRRRVAKGWLVAPLLIIALGVVIWKFVLGVYTLPAESISMAPTLVPGAEGGDAIVLADLLAYRFSGRPQRGDLVVFPYGDRDLVKRVMGLPGETISFRRDDLLVNGKVLVKDRALLDRVRVPLLRLPDYRRTDTGWEPGHALTLGYRLPDGSFDGPVLPAREAVVLARVRARKAPSSVAFVLDDGVTKHTVLLETGIDASVYVGGVEVEGVSHELLRLRPGVEREVWLTNADGSFRVEVDGRGAAPPATLRPGKEARVSIAISGDVEILSFEVARDLAYEGSEHPSDPLGPDEYFVLGDNTARSLDSRSFKAIPGKTILGRVFAVAWPPGRARRVR
ncbi:MAG TPA: signal peptidase I [Planctomycetota bacterium]|nr:signal peptidase I [Planctomycetota bacterium]